MGIGLHFETIEKICDAHYKLPEKGNIISKDAKELLSRLLTKNIEERITMCDVVDHPWVNPYSGNRMRDPEKKLTVIKEEVKEVKASLSGTKDPKKPILNVRTSITELKVATVSKKGVKFESLTNVPASTPKINHASFTSNSKESGPTSISIKKTDPINSKSTNNLSKSPLLTSSSAMKNSGLKMGLMGKK